MNLEDPMKSLSVGALAATAVQAAMLVVLVGCPGSPSLTYQLRHLTAGQLLFNPPNKMRVGDVVRVEVRIAPDATTKISESLHGSGDETIYAIKVSPFMTVKLDGGGAFEIKGYASEDQFIIANDFTQWPFDVKALKSGKHTLQLSVGIRLKFEHEVEERRYYPLFEKEIQVEANPLEVSRNFWSRNWQWIGTAILIPLIAAFIRVWWKRREEKRTTRRIVDPKDDDISKIIKPYQTRHEVHTLSQNPAQWRRGYCRASLV
jgi:hypothetical protein